jgi:transposase
VPAAPPPACGSDHAGIGAALSPSATLATHHAAKRLAEHRDDIEVFFLPPYSPELNPDEYLNGDLKRAVHQDVPPRDREELHATALGHLRRIQKSPGRVRRYFRHRSIRYAAAETLNARRSG